MKKTAFLFPGQGSQSVGMLADIAAHSILVQQTFTEASDVLGYDLWEITRDGPSDKLGQTEITQPALLAAGIATWRTWKDLGGSDPDYFAGHSLGEYSALVAGGSIRFADAVKLVSERGKMMQAATPAGSGGMAAVIGLEDSVLEEICEKAAEGQVVSCANFNSPGQTVIAGDAAAVDRACAYATEAGARAAIPLSVSVPSHCALMRPAAEQLAQLLSTVEINVPAVPVVHNVDVSIHPESDAIREALALQLWQPVRWSSTIQWLASQGVGQFAECGPGKVLAGLNRRISRELNTVALTDYETISGTVGNWS